MAERYLALPHRFLIGCFRMHDFASAFIARRLFGIKRTVLIVAHLSLFGFLFPDMRKEFGEIAMNILIFILFVSPLAKIFRMRLLIQMVGLRRELGILMAYMATVHGVGYMLDPDWFGIFISPSIRTDFFSIEPRLILGMGAYLLTVPLLLTSNDVALRFLGGKNWKLLHRLVYGAFILAIFHGFFVRSSDWSDPVAFTQAGALIGAYFLAQVLARKNFIAPLRTVITSVGSKYERYTAEQKVAGNSLSF